MCTGGASLVFVCLLVTDGIRFCYMVAYSIYAHSGAIARHTRTQRTDRTARLWTAAVVRLFAKSTLYEHIATTRTLALGDHHERRGEWLTRRGRRIICAPPDWDPRIRARHWQHANKPALPAHKAVGLLLMLVWVKLYLKLDISVNPSAEQLRKLPRSFNALLLLTSRCNLSLPADNHMAARSRFILSSPGHIMMHQTTNSLPHCASSRVAILYDPLCQVASKSTLSTGACKFDHALVQYSRRHYLMFVRAFKAVSAPKHLIRGGDMQRLRPVHSFGYLYFTYALCKL
ncbi:hypothetical protein QBC46DRAFT_412490 [Diplogelasinospora grovesii]|uniref:Uncharacterized protein n=1 Tax=Diplogelasinospora grovesii TaxID=303347 RepID=A0AAN6MZV5_9PEZI|nr:hypothetical protein QBC46DRAFT_412490 [Diplogelasinospora grovesii]